MRSNFCAACTLHNGEVAVEVGEDGSSQGQSCNGDRIDCVWKTFGNIRDRKKAREHVDDLHSRVDAGRDSDASEGKQRRGTIFALDGVSGSLTLRIAFRCSVKKTWPNQEHDALIICLLPVQDWLIQLMPIISTKTLQWRNVIVDGASMEAIRP